jgi:hypothetical protein
MRTWWRTWTDVVRDLHLTKCQPVFQRRHDELGLGRISGNERCHGLQLGGRGEQLFPVAALGLNGHLIAFPSPGVSRTLTTQDGDDRLAALAQRFDHMHPPVVLSGKIGITLLEARTSQDPT